MLDLPRSSGVQLHVTSLPGGRLGDAAFAFVDWLATAGQSWWQVLPLGPPDEHGSPYKAASAFAAWPGFLADPQAKVADDEIHAFLQRHATWAPGWAEYAGGRDAIADQVRFDVEWGELREYAAQRGVKLIGDVPIYVAPGSADHVDHPELFLPGVQAGVPPDLFSADGQLWGNPLYDWPALRRRRYGWWVERLRHTFARFDLARIDHFRAFVAYWSVAAGAPDAREGTWRRGPGRAIFDAAARELGPLPLIAEDLGLITPPVTALRKALGLPGMVILQFAFDPDDPHGPHRPENHTEDAIAYTGTHDSDTLRGWWDALEAPRRAEALAAGAREADPEWSLIEVNAGSPARLAMLQVQDLLGLGSEARMNLPGTTGKSWKWRMQAGALTDAHAARLREITAASGRL